MSMLTPLHEITSSSQSFRVDRREVGYLYQQVADHIAARIATGDLKPNQRLLPEGDLATSYGVSLGTARHATDLLRQRGLVVTLPSKGTFVSDKAPLAR